MKNIHVILNAHIDPVWLWPWQAGFDEALATCRSACDRLDNHPDIIFTRGEAWIYDVIERADPSLFARIKQHIAAGRWEIVGGWWIQPDCNAPSGWAWARQIEIGKRYFESRFGKWSKVGYNVDSFGHAATLPKLLRDHGQENYVMMRPQEHEKQLPARLFRWRGYEGGPEVTTFRIAKSYGFSDQLEEDHFEAALTELPDGVEDTMCFVGVGDHGGGPTEQQIAWIREREYAFPGARLIFSSPQRFFDKVKSSGYELPLVTGELQMHAVGCYSVHRGVKTALRRAEHAVYQAEIQAASSVDAGNLEKSWQYVAFAQFHDTLGGTCLPTAYPAIIDQLGFSSAVADEALQFELRKKITRLPDYPLQRIVAWNASDKPWKGFFEPEPWLVWKQWQPSWRILNQSGEAVPYQVLHSEAQVNGLSRLLIPVELAPGEITTFGLDRTEDGMPASLVNMATVTNGVLANDTGVLCNNEGLTFGSLHLPEPMLHLIEDKTDTWSHDTHSYSNDTVAKAEWQETITVDEGPLMASTIQHGKIGESRVTAEWRVYAGLQEIDLKVTVHWLEKFKILKLVVPVETGDWRTDGICGGSLQRPNDGKEMPLRDWTLIPTNGSTLGIAAPDVYAADATSERVRFTLLRSPWLAWHDPNSGGYARGVVADQGVHEFRFRFIYGVNETDLDNLAMGDQRPLILADTTRGMPTVK